MNRKTREFIREYGFLAERAVVMSESAAAATADKAAPSFERIAALARQKAGLSEEAFAPVERVLEKRSRGRGKSFPFVKLLAAAGAAAAVIIFFAVTPTGRALAEAAIRGIENAYHAVTKIDHIKKPDYTEEAYIPAADTEEPTLEPTEEPIEEPTLEPTAEPAVYNTPTPTATPAPTQEPTPTPEPTREPAIAQPTPNPLPQLMHTCGEIGCTEGTFNGCIACSKRGGLHICEVNFPDTVLRSCVSSYIDSDHDGILFASELEGSNYIDVDAMGVGSLSGIEYFEKLVMLRCCDNRLTSIDLSHNTLLRHLECAGNSLTKLTLRGLGDLEYIDCGGNPIVSIDLGGTGKVKTLKCSRCMLTSIDQGNNYLTYLDCSYNYITEIPFGGNWWHYLDISHNRIAYIDCGSNSFWDETFILSPQDIGSVGCTVNNGNYDLDISVLLGGRHEKITAVYGLNDEDEWVQGAYHVRKGLARFQFLPRKLRYIYDTGKGEMTVYVDVVMP